MENGREAGLRTGVLKLPWFCGLSRLQWGRRWTSLSRGLSSLSWESLELRVIGKNEGVMILPTFSFLCECWDLVGTASREPGDVSFPTTNTCCPLLFCLLDFFALAPLHPSGPEGCVDGLRTVSNVCCFLPSLFRVRCIRAEVCLLEAFGISVHALKGRGLPAMFALFDVNSGRLRCSLLVTINIAASPCDL